MSNTYLGTNCHYMLAWGFPGGARGKEPAF